MKKVILGEPAGNHDEYLSGMGTDSATGSASRGSHDAGTERSRRCAAGGGAGRMVMRDNPFARLALFHGQPDSAKN